MVTEGREGTKDSDSEEIILKLDYGVCRLVEHQADFSIEWVRRVRRGGWPEFGGI